MTPAQLLGAVLRDVSRSFYISIRILPRRVREPVGLAYLLARVTDTIADTNNAPVAQRAEMLRRLSRVIGAEGDPNVIVDLSEKFAPLQTNESERKLIEALPDCLQMLALLNAADRGDIRDALANITRGQMLDLERPVLTTAAELDEYTYLVAGCVGEFWTHICCRYIDNFATRPENEMVELGTRYGKGLQLINILRDAHVDLANGRCYFPQEEVGSSPNDWPRLEAVYRKYLEEAQHGLEAGMEYVRAINHFRVRAATVLPALIGARTLSILRATGENVLRERVKISRKEVRTMIATVALTLAKRATLDEMFERYKK
ncbi:MAG: farnesyl-diphosphate farnesyltransferase [Verrucomicrobiota bacterium]|jgi:farnesyl-diphosphate farnesyltransferase